MHINVIPNRGAAPTILLRESFRDGTKVCKRTLANLSALSAAQVQMIRGALRGDVLQAVEKTFEVIASPAHGHVQAVFLAMQRLGDKLKLIGASAQVRRQSLVAWALSTKRVLVCFDAIGAKLVEELALDRWYFHAGLAIASSKRRPNSLLKPHVNLVVVSQQLSESAGQPCTVVGRLS